MIVLYVVAVLFVSLCLFNRLLPAPAARLGMALVRRRSGLQRKQASLPYLEGGSGSETIVLLHGFGADKDNFTRVAAWLTPHFRVIIPDLPGFGEARRDAGEPHDMVQQMENVRTLLAELGIGRVHLGGSSMGGFIISEFAARYPQQVSSLWLLDPAGTEVAFDVAIVAQYRRNGEMPLLVRAPSDYQALLDVCMERIPYFPYCVKHQLAQRAAADFTLHTQIMRDLQQAPKLEAQYRRIETPALIVWGKQDRVLNPRGATAMQALLPDSQVVLMEGIGHLPMVEAPRQAASDYLAFLRGLALRQSAAAAA
jgi:triacylglycerol lipase